MTPSQGRRLNVGDEVEVRPLHGKAWRTRVTSAPWLMGDTWLLRVEGKRAGVALACIEIPRAEVPDGA